VIRALRIDADGTIESVMLELRLESLAGQLGIDYDPEDPNAGICWDRFNCHLGEFYVVYEPDCEDPLNQVGSKLYQMIYGDDDSSWNGPLLFIGKKPGTNRHPLDLYEHADHLDPAFSIAAANIRTALQTLRRL
jgi:hypothetical protein